MTGDDILSAYNSSNYYSYNGTLGNSCMNDELDSISFYAENTKVCSVLVLYEDNKILGRAILWITTKNKKLMDRIYTNRDSDIEAFRKWALDNGYYYKSKNNSMIGSPFTGKDDTLHDVINIKIANKLSPSNIYPYLDTFGWGYDNILTNSEPDDISLKEYYSLRATNGELEVWHSGLFDYLGEQISESFHLKYSYSDISRDDYVLDNNPDLYYCSIDDFYRANPDIKNPYKVLEKSSSRSQQRLFGWAYACKKGYIDRCPRSIKKLGQSMKNKDLKDFAKTKHKNLPERINKKK